METHFLWCCQDYGMGASSSRAPTNNDGFLPSRANCAALLHQQNNRCPLFPHPATATAEVTARSAASAAFSFCVIEKLLRVASSFCATSKKAKARLRELPSAARGSLITGSRNLFLTFLHWRSATWLACRIRTSSAIYDQSVRPSGAHTVALAKRLFVYNLRCRCPPSLKLSNYPILGNNNGVPSLLPERTVISHIARSSACHIAMSRRTLSRRSRSASALSKLQVAGYKLGEILLNFFVTLASLERISLQGDPSGCSLGFVDIKTKVLLQYMIPIL